MESGNDVINNPEFLSYLKDIAVNAALITYYMASSTKAWYELVSFLNSAKAFLCGGVGFLIGLFVGKR